MLQKRQAFSTPNDVGRGICCGGLILAAVCASHLWRRPGERLAFTGMTLLYFSHLQFGSLGRRCLLCRLALFLEEFRGPAFQFRDLNVFDVGREEPLVPGGILHAAATIAVELICRLHH